MNDIWEIVSYHRPDDHGVFVIPIFSRTDEPERTYSQFSFSGSSKYFEVVEITSRDSIAVASHIKMSPYEDMVIGLCISDDPIFIYRNDSEEILEDLFEISSTDAQRLQILDLIGKNNQSSVLRILDRNINTIDAAFIESLSSQTFIDLALDKISAGIEMGEAAREVLLCSKWVKDWSLRDIPENRYGRLENLISMKLADLETALGQERDAIMPRRRGAGQKRVIRPTPVLPDFEALRSQHPFGSASVVVAKIVNFDDLVVFLPGDGHRKLLENLTRRLMLAQHGIQLHRDQDGTFAWLVPHHQQNQIEGQLSGLAALFNAPLTIGEIRVDVAIAFGINDEIDGSNAQRLAAALVAAERAVRTRALWTRYTPRQKDDANWQLSFHSQFEEALLGGDIWVAYQPQYEIATSRLVGIEALARWTHPTRGPIPPDEFIVYAEKSKDIYRLTLFVMDQAIRSAAEARTRALNVHVSVNLSATLLDHSDLVGTIRVMLTAHNLPSDKLTIEITETAQFDNSRQARRTLAQLRRAGVRLSIDDYGTGQSNLEYLTEISADEIKIDKRFVMTMRDSQRNLEVVKSTIDLAHRLGAVAVAEGVEDEKTMELLRGLGCDIAQGYHLGKPQLFSEFLASIEIKAQSRGAEG